MTDDTRRANPNDAVLDWPLAAGEPGREVWYGLVGRPTGGLAFWFRYTLLSTRAGHREARVWAALTDAERPERSFLATRRYPLDAVSAGEGPFRLAVAANGTTASEAVDDDSTAGDGPSTDGDADAELTSRSARGRVAVGDGTVVDGERADDGTTDGSTDPGIGSTLDGATVEWELGYEPDAVTFTPLRSRRLTDLAVRVLGTGRHWSANESVRVDGRLDLGNESVAFEDAPGHQGHTVGTNAPTEWSWVQCNAFETPDVALEALSTGGSLSICFRHDGETHFLNRLHHVVGPRANATSRNEPGSWAFRGRGEGVSLEARVESEGHWQRAAYFAPDDTRRYVAHCSLSRVAVRYRVREGGRRGEWGPPRRADSDAGRAEWGSTERPVPGAYRPTDWPA
jgi:hypothetical protein